MKKLLFPLLALVATMPLMTSCSDDTLSGGAKSGNMSTVSFTTELPAGIQTRAYADGTTATSLKYAIYESGTTTPLKVFGGDATYGTATLTAKKATVTMQLATGKNYDVVFWADAGGNSPYQFDADSHTITVKQALTSNNENNDAFYAHQTFKVEGDMNTDVDLKRPFAQVNIGTDDVAAAKNSVFDAKQTKVVMKAYKTLDLNTDEVSNEEEYTYDYADLPVGETFPVATDGKVYQYLSMNYLLVGAEKSIVDVKLTTKDNGSQTIEGNYTNIPVQRNYRTNIYGSLLTNTSQWNLQIAPEFDAPDNNVEVQVTGAANLKSFLAETSAAELAKMDVKVDLAGETLEADGADNTKKEISLKAKSVSFTNGTVNNMMLSVTSTEGGVYLKDVKVAGSINAKGSNARISINSSQEIVVDGLDYTDASMVQYPYGKNGLEINLSNAYLAEKVTVKNSKFSGLGNNAILIFGMPEEGVATIENCEFALADGGEAVRISNKTNSKHFTVNAINCNYTYSETEAVGNKMWNGFIMFEDYTTKEDVYAKKQFANLTINCDNVTYKGVKVTKTNIGANDRSQFTCMCYDAYGPYLVTDPSHFPTFNFK